MPIDSQGVDVEEFRILYVCTGNICRSPFAEILTRHLLRGKLGGRASADFVVSSAGVAAVVDAPMHEVSRSELAPWGLDADGYSGVFVARQLRSELTREADLILGASRRHRAAVVERAPGTLATTFTIREFARLAEAVPPELLPAHPVLRARRLVEEARLRRGRAGFVDPVIDDVPDPIGGTAEDHGRAADLIKEAVQAIVHAICTPVQRNV